MLYFVSGALRGPYLTQPVLDICHCPKLLSESPVSAGTIMGTAALRSSHQGSCVYHCHWPQTTKPLSACIASDDKAETMV
jgi:hypothetical protein